MCETKAIVHTIPNICLVSYTATTVFSAITGGVLRDNAKIGCVADEYHHTTSLTNMWDWGYVHTIPNIYLVCYTATAVFSVVTRGVLCDNTKNGCVAD